MHDNVTLALAIWSAILVWTGSVIGGMLWLTGKFRHLEKLIYRETDAVRIKQRDLETRIFKTELKVFGFTPSNLESEQPKP